MTSNSKRVFEPFAIAIVISLSLSPSFSSSHIG